jgi:hypothetical protein
MPLTACFFSVWRSSIWPMPPVNMIGLRKPQRSPVQAQVKGAGEALDQRFAELVAVVRGAVAGLDLDFQGRGQGVRAGVAVFPFQRVVGDVQVGHAVAGGAGHDQTAPAGALDVADAAAGAGLGAGKGGHAGGEVVGLGGEQRMVTDLGRLQRRGRARLGGHAGWRVWPSMTLELSLKATLLPLGLAARVSVTTWNRVRSYSWPSITCLPRKKPWRECSELALLRSMISTMVGLRPQRSTK